MVIKVLNKKYFYVFLTVLWIGFIFSLSLQTAEVSSATSSKVGRTIIENSPSKISEKIDVMPTFKWRQFHNRLRTCAHFTEYFVLGILVYLTIKQTMVVHKVGIATVFCMIVAVSDETVQWFVDGRATELSDMLVDSCGSLIGIGVIYIIVSRIMCKRNK